MYPNLTAPLVVILGAAFAVLAWALVRKPVLRWLALRQVARRRAEAALVITGSVLGTAIIVGALVVGDTLGSSVRQEAYRQLGPIDERVVSLNASVGAQASERLSELARTSPNIDGVLTTRVDQAAAERQLGPSRILAEPRVLAWEVNFADAARFGAVGGPSGLPATGPARGSVIVNAPLAKSLQARVGDNIVLFLGQQPTALVVSGIVPERGVAGAGFGATLNRNAYVSLGTFDEAGLAQARTVTFVSNRGGVQSGNALTSQVSGEVRRALGPLSTLVTVETPKHDVLRAADRTGDALGALFLMIGSFSIIAGALLLVNIFVMLAEERKGQLGMLRAAGMKRSHLVGAFTLEGTAYAVVASIVGVGVGIGVGRGVAYLAGKIFNSWSADGTGLQITFAVTPTSLINGAALGLVISLVTIVATSIRISRFNIIASIRDLDVEPAPKTRRRLVIVMTSLAVLFGVAAVPAVASSQAVNTFLLPSLALFCLTPLLTRFVGKRWSYTVISALVLMWSLLANVVRPAIFDSPSMAVYVVMGSLLAFSGVLLISENQEALLRPLRRFIDRPSEAALAGRLAVAYPTAKKFRTGATLIMYTLIVLVLVLLNEIGGVITNSIDSQVASATAGYSVRLDFNSAGSRQMLQDLKTGEYAGQVAGVAPLTSAAARSTDPGGRTKEPLDTVVVGVPSGAVSAMQFAKRLPGLSSDRAVWQALATHPSYVVVDNFFGATGGPAGEYYVPGDTFAITDPRSGATQTKTIVGILRNATMFYSPLKPTAYPVIANDAAVRTQFGAVASVGSAFLQTKSGVSPDALATQLQGSYLSSSLVATPMASTIRRMFNANFSFFRIMQGFLALGLVVGITGLGVVMVRAVRERRRTIGILRALGFRSRTIERSFLLESGFVALEGVVLGSVLGMLTTWLMYQKSASFDGIRNGFPILWQSTLLLCGVTLVASVLATFGPARRAARILPALATRVTD